MNTFFYFQNLMWLTDIIDIEKDKFFKSLKESCDEKYTEHDTWYDAQYSWYGIDRLTKEKKDSKTS